ncbi:MAG: DUF3987 domain-containing protein [Desulfobacteraceae bacterium]|nr:DUF3987 domain-containing protein [Desulfobacteraceae bacterium]
MKITIQKADVNSHFEGHCQDFFSQYTEIKSSAGLYHKIVCPFHDDSDPSLSFRSDTGLWKCFGCKKAGDIFKFYGLLKGFTDASQFPEILKGIGQDFGINGSGSTAGKSSRSSKKEKGRIVAEYDYTDEKGNLHFQVVRLDPKGFRQRRPDGKGGYVLNMDGVQKVLYRLQEVLQAELVLIPEGEKDVDNLRELGFTATTSPGGAEKWLESYGEALAGRDVVLLPDKDEVGFKHVQKIAKSLNGVARSTKILELPGLPAKGDVSDWIEAGGTKEELEKMISECPSWEPGETVPDIGNDVEWEDPVLLDDFSLPEMEPLPGIIGEFSEAVSAATETPLELAQGLALAAVATACQGKVEVQVKPGYSEPVNIWINVALESGNRKSSVHAEVTRPLLTWEAEKREELEPVVREAESQRKNQEARLKSLRARYGKAGRDELPELEHEIRELEEELEEVPVMPKVWVQDITPEHLGTVMSLHGGKISIMSAEGGIFDIIGGRYSKGIPNLDLFLQGHSGDPVRVDRGSRDSIYLESPALSMGLSPQPEVLKSIADAPGFRGRGLLARNLYLLPGSRLGHRKLETDPVSKGIRDRWEIVVHALLNLEPSSDERGRSVPHILSLTYSAYEEWLEFSRWVEKDLREGGRFENIMDWAGKLPGATARLAGLLHCVQHPEQPWSGQIEIDIMRQALGLGAIFSSHALKVFNLMGADKSLEGSRKVWKWVERGRFRSFSKRDCYNSLKGSFPRVADIESPLDVLEERNYVTSSKETTGGRPTVTYRVHPQLSEEW